MKRRDFLKAVGAVVIAPSLPVPKAKDLTDPSKSIILPNQLVLCTGIVHIACGSHVDITFFRPYNPRVPDVQWIVDLQNTRSLEIAYKYKDSVILRHLALSGMRLENTSPIELCVTWSTVGYCNGS